MSRTRFVFTTLLFFTTNIILGQLFSDNYYFYKPDLNKYTIKADREKFQLQFLSLAQKFLGNKKLSFSVTAMDKIKVEIIWRIHI